MPKVKTIISEYIVFSPAYSFAFVSYSRYSTTTCKSEDVNCKLLTHGESVPIKSTLTKAEAVYLCRWVELRFKNSPKYPFPSEEHSGMFAVQQGFFDIQPNDINSLTDWMFTYLSDDNRKRFWSAWRQHKKKENDKENVNKKVKKHMTFEAAIKLDKLANKHGCTVSEYILKYL